jgi:hypothetical protein
MLHCVRAITIPSLVHRYVNLGDVAFWRADPTDGGARDYFWQSRDSALLIKGGANYAYEQIESELETFLNASFKADTSAGGDSMTAGRDFKLAVCGLKLTSEHEDDCVATVELLSDLAAGTELQFETKLLKEAKKSTTVCKAAVPSFIRFATIPRNFKGSILLKDLAASAMSDAPAMMAAKK